MQRKALNAADPTRCNAMRSAECRGLTIGDLRSGPKPALYQACQNGQLAIVQYLMTQGLPIDDLRF